MNRSFLSVFACLLLCPFVTFVIFLGFGRRDLAVIKGDELLPVRATQTGTCLEETICRRHPTETFYEYRRGQSFFQSVKLDSTPNKERNLPVPNIIHFSRFTGRQTYFRFHELIAVMAAQRAMTIKIYFWFDFLPFGENWNKLIEKSSNIYLIHRTVDRSITKPSSTSDLEEQVRFEAVLEFGGTGVTFDIILLKSLKQFFDYDTTMAMMTNSISSDIVVAKPWSSFMRTWYIMDSKTTQVISSKTFSSIANNHKELLHIESDLITPRNKDLSYLYKEGGHFDSNKDVLCIKLWFEEHGVEHGLKDIGSWNTVVGKIFRHIYGYKAEG